MGIRKCSTPILSLIFCLFFSCGNIADNKKAINTDSYSTIERIDVFYEKNAPFLIQRYIYWDADMFLDLDNHKNLKFLQCNDSLVISNLKKELENGVVLKDCDVDARIICLIKYLDRKDTLTLDKYPSLPYLVNSKGFINEEVYYVIWNYLFNNDLEWKMNFSEEEQLFNYDYSNRFQ